MTSFLCQRVAVAAVLGLSPMAAAQEGEPRSAGQEQGQPQIQVQSPGAQMPGNPRKIQDVKDYRGGLDTMPYVRRLEDVRDLDLSRVDFEAPVLARINGKEVTQDQFKLWLAFTGGQNGVLRAQLVALTNAAIRRMERAGETPDFAVADEEVDARIREEEDMARAQGEEYLKGYYSRIESTLGMDRYREFVRAHLLSERLLLPPIKPLKTNVTEGTAADGAQQPVVEVEEVQSLPVEAAELLENDPQIRDYLANAYLTGQEFPAMFRTQFLRMLQEKMIDRADIRYAVEDETVPSGVYMIIKHGEDKATGEVDETQVPVSDILAFTPPGRENQEYALQLLLLYHAIDDELKGMGAELSDEDFELIFEAHEAEYAHTIFPLRNLITLRGFLNMAEYREFYRRRAAFERWVQNTLSQEELDAELMAHHQKFGKLFYQSGKVTVQTVYSSLEAAIRDGGEAGAWDRARERIEQAYAAVQGARKGAEESGKPPAVDEFAEVREKLGHPLANEPSGVLVSKMRMELRNLIGETDYSVFVAGYSLSDDLFYNRVEGEVVGPVKLARSIMPGLRATLGYLIAKPTEYQTVQELKPFEAQKQLIQSDYFDQRFNWWSHECLKKADVELVAER